MSAARERGRPAKIGEHSGSRAGWQTPVAQRPHGPDVTTRRVVRRKQDLGSLNPPPNTGTDHAVPPAPPSPPLVNRPPLVAKPPHVLPPARPRRRPRPADGMAGRAAPRGEARRALRAPRSRRRV